MWGKRKYAADELIVSVAIIQQFTSNHVRHGLLNGRTLENQNMMKKGYNQLLLIFLLLPGFAHAQTKLASVDLNNNAWYKNSIIYNLEVGVFKDSDGDGRGDFNGLTQKLDYLTALGVDAIWLAPFQPSPGQDDGYDVADFYGVEKRLGSSGDFAEFIFQAQKRGIRVIMDLVLNHTSTQHPWFQNARTGPQSKYRNWYVWSEKLPKDYDKGMVFPGVQKAVWTKDSVSGQYYYHRFYNFQPDLNYANREVVLECQKVIGYWLNQGISGFRLDAVPFIIELPNSSADKPKLDFDLLMDLRQFAQSRKADVMILGEANVMPEDNENYFGKNGEGMQMMFNFYANQHLFYALASGNLEPFKKAITETKTIPDASQWAHFLRNHDEIDLGRLTDKQRREVYKKFGPDTNMQLYDRGIRRRLATMLGNNKNHIRLAYSLLYSLPGTPVVRYGDEIGMGDDLRLKERTSVRTPMQWTADRNAGFTSADSAFRPVIDFGEHDFRKVNVAAQLRDTSSMLHWTTRMIALRKSCPEIGLGTYTVLETGSPFVFGIRYDFEGSSLVILHNFSEKPQQTSVTLPGTKTLFDQINTNDVKASLGKYMVPLAGYGYKWYRVDQAVRN
ncbi:alpha-amylase family protein [Dyadobacter sp. CY323]|uniref:alpha-amylase family protein n=1 Tax=Dyadobacter sp. CY323 TaxID=2907302 RepID=UPI001F23490B|nr:alpha-amylase family protein [Dyadobacter sp. CY323]MCE6988024.1 alpha-amylase family protein [Dyadobacter sp. CY323]